MNHTIVSHFLPGRNSTKLAEILFETIHTRLINLTESTVVARSRASVEHDLPEDPELQCVLHEAALLPPFPSSIFVAAQWGGGPKILSESHQLAQRPNSPPITHGV